MNFVSVMLMFDGLLLLYLQGLDSEDTGTVKRRNKTVVTPKMAMESFRYSFLNADGKTLWWRHLVHLLFTVHVISSC